MDELTTRFQDLYTEYGQKGISAEEITQHLQQHIRNPALKAPNRNVTSWQVGNGTLILLSIPVAVLSLLLLIQINWVSEVLDSVQTFVSNQPCVIENNMISMEMTRPLFNCSICMNITEIDVLEDITQEEFTLKYAFTKVPVLIQGATKNWSAPNVFNLEFFKRLYTEEALKTTMERCQFFGYKTELTSLKELFEMSAERANLEPGEKPWYIGWSNCHEDVKEELRKHYSKPHFLPRDAEHSSLDWIFMGGPGNGAHVHLDRVSMPSWQAQLSGKKTWYLQPVPECEALCHPLNVTLHTGDIFVVDTNHWYHSTQIHPGQISITIGSEYN